MPKFIKVTDFGSGIPIYLNAEQLFSIHRPQGTDCTVVKGHGVFEQVKETEVEILEMAGIIT